MVKLPEQVSQKLTNANVFFTILIVWLHVSANYKLPEWVIGITVYSVPCFFAISSFLYFKSYDFNNPWADYKQKVSRRFNSLIVPFLIFNVVGFLFSLLCYQLHHVEHNPIETLMTTNPLLYLLESKANGPLWYFIALFTFVLVAPVLGYIIRLSMWTILLLPFVYWLCKDVRYYYFPYWMVDLFIGAYIALHYDKLTNIKISKNLQMGGVILSLLVLLLGTFGMIEAYTARALGPLCFIIIYGRFNILPLAFVRSLAPYTLLIYCLHIPISRIAIRVPRFMHIHVEILSLTISTAVTVLIIIGIGWILKKNKRVWSIITGGR